MTGANVLLKPGTCLTRALIYGPSVVDIELPSTASSAGVVAASLPAGEGNCVSLGSHVKVVDFPALRPRLIDIAEISRHYSLTR